MPLSDGHLLGITPQLGADDSEIISVGRGLFRSLVAQSIEANELRCRLAAASYKKVRNRAMFDAAINQLVRIKSFVHPDGFVVNSKGYSFHPPDNLVREAWEALSKAIREIEITRDPESDMREQLAACKKALLQEETEHNDTSARLAAAEKDALDSIAGRLIDAWCAAYGRHIPWAKAVELISIVTKQPDAERDKLLRMGDEDGSCEMCGRSDAAIAAGGANADE